MDTDDVICNGLLGSMVEARKKLQLDTLRMWSLVIQQLRGESLTCSGVGAEYVAQCPVVLYN